MTFAKLRGTGLALAIAAAILLQRGATAHAQEVQVTIDNFTFAPAELAADNPAHRGVGRQIQVEDDGYRRQVLVHFHLRG